MLKHAPALTLHMELAMQRANRESTEHPGYAVYTVEDVGGRPHVVCAPRPGNRFTADDRGGVFTPEDEAEPVWVICGRNMTDEGIARVERRLGIDATIMRECRDAARDNQVPAGGASHVAS